MLNEIKTQGGKVTLYTERPKSKYSYTLICTDIDVDDDVQTLTLISNSHEIEADYVMYDFRSVKKQFPNVETLVITEMVIDVYVSNMMFPTFPNFIVPSAYSSSLNRNLQSLNAFSSHPQTSSELMTFEIWHPENAPLQMYLTLRKSTVSPRFMQKAFIRYPGSSLCAMSIGTSLMYRLLLEMI